MLLLPQRHARAPFALRACYLFPMCAFVRTTDIQDRIFPHILSASCSDSLGKPGPNITEASPGWSTCLVFGRVSAQLVSSTTFLTRIRGGIRGIVELQVLNEIEWVLGGQIPIQDFFDLIVGTRSVLSVTLVPADNANATPPVSTGGIIALALGVQNWPIQDCISKFKQLCSNAFMEREFSGILLFEQLATANHKSKYKNKPFEKVLETLFGKDLLFGGGSQPQHYARSVAVTTTTGVGTEPRILANYNRPNKQNRES